MRNILFMIARLASFAQDLRQGLGSRWATEAKTLFYFPFSLLTRMVIEA